MIYHRNQESTVADLDRILYSKTITSCLWDIGYVVQSRYKYRSIAERDKNHSYLVYDPRGYRTRETYSLLGFKLKPNKPIDKQQ